MTPIWLDHLFVVVVLGLIFPFGGWYAYRRFLDRVKRDGDRALVREYKITMVWLLMLGLCTLGIWALAGRPFALLGLAPLGGNSDFVSSLAGGAAGGLVLRPLLAAVSRPAAGAIRRQFAKLEAFLPKTGEQLVLGLAVSVFAGLFEEIAYRGYLLFYFRTWFDQWEALAASSVLFGLAHLYQGKAGTLLTGLLGAAFGTIYLATGSLLLPIALHALVDISSMVTAWIVLRRRTPIGEVP